MRLPKLPRWIKYPLVLIALVGLAGWLWLRSSAATNLARSRIEAALGVPVGLDDLSVGTNSTRLRGLSLPDDDGTAWLRVGEASADVGLTAIAGGPSPSSLTLRDVVVRLRFDESGKLITRLPTSASSTGAKLPPVHLHNGTLIFAQTGRPESAFAGIDLELTPGENGYTITGDLDDPLWKGWRATGSLSNSLDVGELRLDTREAVPATQKMLDDLPFVGTDVWKQVQISGRTTGSLNIAFSVPKNDFGVEVDLQPVDATLHISSIDLTTERTSGRIGIRGGLVVLSTLRGFTADGALEADGVLDFRGADSVLDFTRLRMEGLRVAKLPARWNLPKSMDGQFVGEAALKVVIPPSGPVKTSGSGSAIIRDTTLAGHPVAPVRLAIEPVGDGFAFVSTIAFQAPMAFPPDAPAKPPGLYGTMFRWLEFLFRPGTIAARDGVGIKLSLKAIRLSELLAKSGTTIPVRVGGDLSADVEMRIPSASADDFRTWTIVGTLASPRLTVEDQPLESVAADFRIVAGVLQVRSLTATVPSADPNTAGPGKLSLSGLMRLEGDYRFDSRFVLENVDTAVLKRLDRVLKLPIELAGPIGGAGGLSGTLVPAAVSGSGVASSPDIRVGIARFRDAKTTWAVTPEVVSIRDFTGKLSGGLVSGSGDIPLGDGAGAVTLGLKGLKLDELSDQFPKTARLKLEGVADGTVELTISANAPNRPRAIRADLTLTADSLKLQGIPAEKIVGTIDYRDGRVKYGLKGSALGGEFEVTGAYPPDASPDLPGKVSIRGVRLDKLRALPEFRKYAASIPDGRVTVDFPYEIDGRGEIRGTGRFQIDGIRFPQMTVTPRLQGEIRAVGDTLRLDNISAVIGEGALRASIEIPMENIERSRFTLRLDHVPAKPFLMWAIPENADRVEGPIDAVLSGTLGRTIRAMGVLTMMRGKIAGVPVADLRVPVDLTVRPNRGRVRLEIHGATGMVAGGRASGEAGLRLSPEEPAVVSAALDFRDIDLEALSRGSEAFGGANRLTGKLTLESGQLRTLDDLRGRLDATLGESQPFELPFFSQLLPFLGPTRSQYTRTRSGEVHATLFRKTWTLQKLTLEGPTLGLMITGTVGLDGRLDLDALASLGNLYSSTSFLRNVATRVLVDAILPVGLVADVTRYLANRAAHLSITGTASNPVIRIKPIETLSQEAVQFFVFLVARRISP